MLCPVPHDGGDQMKTYMPSASSIERKWYVVDAADMTLGRLASEVAKVLRGKNKPEYTPFLDMGVCRPDKAPVIWAISGGRMPPAPYRYGKRKMGKDGYMPPLWTVNREPRTGHE